MSFGTVGNILFHDLKDDTKKETTRVLNNKGEVLHELEIKKSDPLKVSEKILSDMDRLHLDTLKEYVQAMTEEEKMEIASVIPAPILLESLSKEFDRLLKLERRTMDLFGVHKYSRDIGDHQISWNKGGK